MFVYLEEVLREMREHPFVTFLIIILLGAILFGRDAHADEELKKPFSFKETGCVQVAQDGKVYRFCDKIAPVIPDRFWCSFLLCRGGAPVGSKVPTYVSATEQTDEQMTTVTEMNEGVKPPTTLRVISDFVGDLVGGIFRPQP